MARATLAMVEAEARAKSLALVNEVTEAPSLLNADPRKVKQMLINLLSNAVKFTERGSITVSLRRLASQEVALTVADTGIGIAADDLAKAMAPFGQVDSSLARRHQGTGLGLPLTKALIELHGGRFELASEPNVGTQASLIFPAARVIARD
ncbi:MAG: hypothetical protein FJX52_05160 [Alphaproteobacteria bacterium]|nr:hypothetical protein [Alphaproteobacteria bacterium]